MEKLFKFILICVAFLIIGIFADAVFATMFGLLAIALPYILVIVGIVFIIFIVYSIFTN